MTLGTDGDDGRWNNNSNGGTEGEHLYGNVSNGIEKPTGKTENGQSMIENKATDEIHVEDHARDGLYFTHSSSSCSTETFRSK